MNDYPNILYGSYGDEKVTGSAKIGGLPLGTLMILPDGRKFRHAKASGTAVVAGKLYQQNAYSILSGSADADVLTEGAISSGGVAGSSTVVITAGGTAIIPANSLDDGYFSISSGTASGQTYKIKTNSAAVKSGTCTLTLWENDQFKTTLSAGSSKYGIRQNEYNNVTLTTANTVSVGTLAGVPPVAASADFYFWIQRSGPCAVYTLGTLIVGEPVCVAGTAGGVRQISPAAAATSGTRIVKQLVSIGYCMNISASTKYSLVNLTLE